jgi:hypothetical protein
MNHPEVDTGGPLVLPGDEPGIRIARVERAREKRGHAGFVQGKDCREALPPRRQRVVALAPGDREDRVGVGGHDATDHRDVRDAGQCDPCLVQEAFEIRRHRGEQHEMARESCRSQIDDVVPRGAPIIEIRCGIGRGHMDGHRVGFRR